MIIGAFLKIAHIFLSFLFYGESLRHTRASCLAEYGNYLYKAGDIDRAIKYYKRALLFDQDNFYAHSGSAASLVRKGLFQEALDHCNKALTAKSDESLRFLLIAIYELLGQQEAAKQVFEQTASLNKNLVPVYQRMAYAYVQFGLYQSAESCCLKAIQYTQDAAVQAILLSNLAEIHKKQERIREARSEFEKVLQLSPDKSLRKLAVTRLSQISRMTNKEGGWLINK